MTLKNYRIFLGTLFTFFHIDAVLLYLPKLFIGEKNIVIPVACFASAIAASILFSLACNSDNKSTQKEV